MAEEEVLGDLAVIPDHDLLGHVGEVLVEEALERLLVQGHGQELDQGVRDSAEVHLETVPLLPGDVQLEADVGPAAQPAVLPGDHGAVGPVVERQVEVLDSDLDVVDHRETMPLSFDKK